MIINQPTSPPHRTFCSRLDIAIPLQDINSNYTKPQLSLNLLLLLPHNLCRFLTWFSGAILSLSTRKLCESPVRKRGMGSYPLNSNMAIDITSPINNAAATHSLEDIRRVRRKPIQKKEQRDISYHCIQSGKLSCTMAFCCFHFFWLCSINPYTLSSAGKGGEGRHLLFESPNLSKKSFPILLI